MDSTNVNQGFLEMLPSFLQRPETYIFIFLFLIFLVFVALYKNRNIKLSFFGKPIIDIEAKESVSSGYSVPKSPLNIDKKDDNKNNDKDTQRTKNQGFPPHRGCAHVNDFILIITETTNVVSKISEIKFKGCMSEQLFKADQHLMRFRALYQNEFRKNLRKKAVTDDEALRNYKYYQLFTRAMLEDIKDMVIRNSFLNNHLITFEKDKYIEYIDNNFVAIKNVIDDGVNDMYVGEWVIGQNELHDLHKGIDVEAKAIVKDIFMDAREIAQRQYSKIAELESGLKDFVSRIVGI